MEKNHKLKLCIFDIENEFTVRKIKGKDRTYGSPYTPSNKLISLGLRHGVRTALGIIWQPCEYYEACDIDRVKQSLVQADMLIGHNIKHDIEWGKAVGINFERYKIWDTIIGEWVLLRGKKGLLSLKEVALRRKLKNQKLDIDFGDGQWADKIAWDTLKTYGIADLMTTGDLFEAQLADFSSKAHNSLLKQFKMMCDFLPVLVEMKSNGLKIDMGALNKLAKDYDDESAKLQTEMQTIIREVCGATPINLNSTDDMSKLFYSFEVLDKHKWTETFNIGYEERGAGKKPKPLTRMSDRQLREAVTKQTKALFRTTAKGCISCNGSGYYFRTRKSGENFKRSSVCPDCNGEGVRRTNGTTRFGFQYKPISYKFASESGFSTDKETIRILQQEQNSELGSIFVEKYIRYNAIQTYKNNFVDGIINYVESDGIIHPDLLQYVTSTGRLAGRSPNFQNLPRGTTAPVKRCIVSRFNGGKIIEGDFAQLEFRTAGELSGCPKILEDVLNKVDIHTFTSEVIFGDKLHRQDAKSHCLPMYTKILTPDGWKSYEGISLGQEIINYNAEKNCLEKDVVLEIVHPHKQNVVRMKTKHNWAVDSTSDHRWFGSKRVDRGKLGRGYESCEFTTEQVGKEYIIRTASEYKSEGSVSPLDAARIAWLWTDGTFSKTACVVVQKKYKSIVRHIFKDILNKETIRYDNVHYFHINRDYFKSFNMDKNEASNFVLDLSEEARYAWLNAVQLAEGTLRKHGESRIAQNSGPLCEAIKLCGFLCGFDVRTTKVIMKYNGKQHEQITLRERNYVTGQRIIKEDLGEQDVFCLRTTNGSLVIKQDETICISGNSFKPLYGGKSGTQNEQLYYKTFLEKYHGVSKWHEYLKQEAIATKQIAVTQTGMQFSFPQAKRTGSGYVIGETNIVNYPVQYFATGVITPLACIGIYGDLKAHGLKSLLVLTVHDSVIVDAFPGEEAQVAKIMQYWLSEGVITLIKKYFGYDFKFPLDSEIKISVTNNWLETRTYEP